MNITIAPISEYVLTLLQAGFHKIIPINRTSDEDGNKTPAIKSWKEEHRQRLPLTDAQVQFRFGNNDHNAAVLLGIPCSFVVIDADDEHAFNTLSAMFPDNPFVTKSKRGGHFYFRVPSEFDIGLVQNNTIIRIEIPTSDGIVTLKNVDVKAQGGYVLAPGSTHSEGFYEPIRKWPWTRGDYKDVPYFDMNWVYYPDIDRENKARSNKGAAPYTSSEADDRITQKRSTFKDRYLRHKSELENAELRSREPKKPREIKKIASAIYRAIVGFGNSPFDQARRAMNGCKDAIDGARGNAITFGVAMFLYHGFDLTEEEAWELMLEYNASKCFPSWSERELRRKLKDAISRPPDRPRGWAIKEAEIKPQYRNKINGSVFEFDGAGASSEYAPLTPSVSHGIIVDPIPSEGLLNRLHGLSFADEPTPEPLPAEAPVLTHEREPGDDEWEACQEEAPQPRNDSHLSAKERLQKAKDAKWPKLGEGRRIENTTKHAIRQAIENSFITDMHRSIADMKADEDFCKGIHDKDIAEYERLIRVHQKTLERVTECGMVEMSGVCTSPKYGKMHGRRSSKRNRCGKRQCCPACAYTHAELLCSMLREKWPDRPYHVACFKPAVEDKKLTSVHDPANKRRSLTSGFQRRSKDMAWVWCFDSTAAYVITYEPELLKQIELWSAYDDMYEVKTVTRDQAIAVLYSALREPSMRFTKFFDLYRNAIVTGAAQAQMELLLEICNFPFLGNQNLQRYGSSKAAKVLLPIPTMKDIARESRIRAAFGKPEDLKPGCCDGTILNADGTTSTCNCLLGKSITTDKGKEILQIPLGMKSYVADKLMKRVASIVALVGPVIDDSKVAEVSKRATSATESFAYEGTVGMFCGVP